MNKLPYDTMIIYLLQRYVDNKCTEEELQKLLKWLKSPENEKNFDVVSDQVWKRIDEETPYPDEKRLMELNREVDHLLKQIRKNEKDIVVTKSRYFSRRRWLYVAALFLLLLGMNIGYNLLKKDNPGITYQEILAERSEIREYTLADGTHIILNSGSKIIIPSDYGKTNRQIEMMGEGFFDVISDPEKPFIIKNGNVQVKVLGTSFNVKTYDEDVSINVTVSTGKVLVNVPDLDLQLRVLSSEHLSINKQTGNVSKFPLKENRYINWIDGNLYFEKEPLQEVLKTINRKYNTTVILQCDDCRHIISGTHDNKNIEAILEAICFTTGLKYKEEGENIILYE